MDGVLNYLTFIPEFQSLRYVLCRLNTLYKAQLRLLNILAVCLVQNTALLKAER